MAIKPIVFGFVSFFFYVRSLMYRKPCAGCGSARLNGTALLRCSVTTHQAHPLCGSLAERKSASTRNVASFDRSVCFCWVSFTGFVIKIQSVRQLSGLPHVTETITFYTLVWPKHAKSLIKLAVLTGWATRVRDVFTTRPRSCLTPIRMINENDLNRTGWNVPETPNARWQSACVSPPRCCGEWRTSVPSGAAV